MRMGIPDLNQFPLQDQSDIQMAVNSFKFCPFQKRKVLFENIMKACKEENFTPIINSNNPIKFFSGKLIPLNESYIEEDALILDDIRRMKVPMLLQKYYDEFLKIMSNITDENPLSIEKKLAPLVKNLNMFYSHNSTVSENLLVKIYGIMDVYYKNFIDSFNYVYREISHNRDIILDSYAYSYYIITDFIHIISTKLFNRKNEESIEKDLEEIDSISHIIVDRIGIEFFKRIIATIKSIICIYGNCKDVAKLGLDDNQTKVDTRKFEIKCDELFLKSTFMTNGSIKLKDSESIIRLLEKQKKENEKQLNIIIGYQFGLSGVCNKNKIVRTKNNIDSMFTSMNVNPSIAYTISKMVNHFIPANLMHYKPSLRLQLSRNESICIEKYFKTNNVFTVLVENGSFITLYIDEKDILYLVTKISDDEYMLIELFKGCEKDYVPFFITDNVDGNNAPPIQGKRIKIKHKEFKVEKLYEGLDIKPNGDILLKFKPKKKFMDEYSEIHKMLLAHDKEGNMEAIKDRLAYLFAFIGMLERDHIYNEDSKRKEEATKARMFAMNDFKTYLKKVQQKEKNFDFNKYFMDSGYGETYISITGDNIKGIKKLFRNIFFN